MHKWYGLYFLFSENGGPNSIAPDLIPRKGYRQTFIYDFFFYVYVSTNVNLLFK